MKTRAVVAAMLAVSLLGGAAAAESADDTRAEAGGEERSDAWITTKVKAKLASGEGVSAVGTDVDTKDGVVTLTGEVDSLAEKDLAAERAKEVEGVRSVDNKLVVKGDAEDERTSDGQQRGLGDRAFAKIDDAAVTSRVKSALAANRSTSAINTNVDTRNGRVTLRGTARSEAEKQLAEKLAKGVSGVKSVDNKIDVAK